MAKKREAAMAEAEAVAQPKDYTGAVTYREDKQVKHPEIEGDTRHYVHFEGVPWSDLTAAEFAAIPPWTRRAMIESGIYELKEGG